MITVGTKTNSLKVARVQINWHAGLPIFASERFLKSFGDAEYGWVGGIDGEGRLRCVLPYSVIRKFGVRLVRFRTATVAVDGELDLEEERSFLGGVADHFRSVGADMIIPSNNTAIFRTYPRGAVAAPYGTLVNDLREPQDVLFNKVHTDYRKKIRSATRAGVAIKCGLEYLDVSYAIIADTLKRSGAEIIISRKEFEKRVLSLGESVKIFVAEHRDVIQACLVSPFSQYSAYTFYGGTIPEPIKGAMHLVHWEAIRTFRDMGVRQFDFQGVRVNPEPGSKQEGIATFKQRFGGRLVQGYLWKYPLRAVQSMAYSIAVRWFKGGDFVDQEQGNRG